MLEEVTDMTGGRVFVGTVATDDDSTLRSYCRLFENGGKSKEAVSEPIILADPSLRVKVRFKIYFATVTSTKNSDEVKHVDALRLRKYTSCYILCTSVYFFVTHEHQLSVFFRTMNFVMPAGARKRS